MAYTSGGAATRREFNRGAYTARSRRNDFNNRLFVHFTFTDRRTYRCTRKYGTYASYGVTTRRFSSILRTTSAAAAVVSCSIIKISTVFAITYSRENDLAKTFPLPLSRTTARTYLYVSSITWYKIVVNFEFNDGAPLILFHLSRRAPVISPRVFR